MRRETGFGSESCGRFLFDKVIDVYHQAVLAWFLLSDGNKLRMCWCL
jgi:hypothetical protein